MLLTPWILVFVGGPTYVVDLREFLKPKLSEEFQPEPLLQGKVYSTCVM